MSDSPDPFSYNFFIVCFANLYFNLNTHQERYHKLVLILAKRVFKWRKTVPICSHLFAGKISVYIEDVIESLFINLRFFSQFIKGLTLFNG